MIMRTRPTVKKIAIGALWIRRGGGGALWIRYKVEVHYADIKGVSYYYTPPDVFGWEYILFGVNQYYYTFMPFRSCALTLGTYQRTGGKWSAWGGIGLRRRRSSARCPQLSCSTATSGPGPHRRARVQNTGACASAPADAAARGCIERPWSSLW